MRYSDADVERFWSKVDKNGECWLWTGAGATGKRSHYGVIKWDGRCEKAHRVAYCLTYGPIPAGLVVKHNCDTPLCVNPAHLSAGTQKSNLEEMLAKGRHGKTRFGWHSGIARAQFCLRELAEARGLNIPAICDRSGLHETTIRSIWYNQRVSIALDIIMILSSTLEVEPGALFRRC